MSPRSRSRGSSPKSPRGSSAKASRKSSRAASRDRSKNLLLSNTGTILPSAASPRMSQLNQKNRGTQAAKWGSFRLLLGMVMALVIPLAMVVIIEGLPPIVTADPSSRFGHEGAMRVRKDMENIAALGTRFIGNEANELHTVEYIIDVLKGIQAQVAGGVVFEIATQRVSGNFNTVFLGGLANVYQDVVNVMCRISLKDPKSRADSLLINAHFDSAISSVGAVDDVVNVAIMLELARMLSSTPSELNGKSVVLLFNGAEESNWQAAHGFISTDTPLVSVGQVPLQQPAVWRRNLRAVINLEAVGSNGREFLVRTGNRAGWVSRLYSSAIRFPRGSVIAEEIFNSGLFPGETDFVVFRDVGHLDGLDIVWIEDGYHYHSPRDTPDRIDDGHIHLFTLAMLKHLTAIKDEPKERAVFFDFLGLIWVWYPAWAAKVINYGCIVWAYVHVLLFSSRAGGWLCIGGAALREAGCALAGILLSVLCGAAMALINPMAWYSNYILSSLQFVPAALLGCLMARDRLIKSRAAAHKASKGSGGGEDFERRLAQCGAMVVVCVSLGSITLLGGLSAYVFLFPLLAMLITESFSGGNKWVHVAVCAVPAVYWWQMIRTVLIIFQPVMGRAGMAVPPDLFMAVICGAITSLMCLPLMTVLAGERGIDRRVFAALALWVLSVAAYSSTVWPYTLDRPKRVLVQHIDRTFMGRDGEVTSKDSGLWVNGFDWRRLTDLQGRGIERFDQAKEHPGCDKGHCNMPWYFPMLKEIRGGWYVNFAPPQVLPDQEFSLSHSSVRADGGGQVRRVNITASGPSHMNAFLVDPQHRVVAWSFGDELGVNKGKRRADGTHFIFWASGGGAEPTKRREWTFWLDIVGDEPLSALVYGHYFNYGQVPNSINVDGCQATEGLKWLRESLPPTFEPACWSSSVIHTWI